MAYSIESVLQQIPDVSCLEGDEGSLFVGTKDGQLLHYVLHRDDPESDSLEYTYLLASRQEAAGRKPPQAIVLLQSVQLAAVCANEQLSFYTLPEFAPASDLRIIKDVQGVIQNSTIHERIDADGNACLTVFTKKKVRQIKVSRQVVKLSKEVEYSGCLAACQRGSIVCVATKSSYDLLDLDRRAKIPLFPVVQGEADPVGSKFDAYLPQITSVTSNEFLLVSGSPESSTTMGIFVTLEGEITRGTLMYEAYPKRILSDFPFVVTLLPDGRLDVHDLNTQQRLQTIQAQDVLDLRRSSHLIPVVNTSHLNLVIFRQNATTSARMDELEKPSGLELNEARKNSDILSSILLCRSAGISALVTRTRLLEIDEKLNAGELQSAISDAERLSRETPPNYAVRLFHELEYIHQKAGLIYFQRMLFDDAIDNFKKGNIDPRVLLSFFPDYESRSSEVQVYAGLLSNIGNMEKVDAIIRTELLRSVDDEATLAELEVIVKANAIELLRRYLTSFREKKGMASNTDDRDAHSLFTVVEIALLRILLEMDVGEAGGKLQAFFRDTVENPEEICNLLEENNQWIYLADLQAKTSNHKQVLTIWRKLVDGELTDTRYAHDGISKINDYLLNFGNDDLFWDFGLWTLRKDTSDGILLFLHAIDAQIVTFSATDVLNRLGSDSDRSVYIRLLEYLVLHQSARHPELSHELIMLYATDLIKKLNDDTVATFLKSSITEYQNMQPPKVPYLTFASELSHARSDSSILTFVDLRTKFINMLQSSADYDAQAVLDLVTQRKDCLLAERILLYGRLSKHAESINLMVHDLQDFDSAEVYCYHGGISLSQIRLSSDKAGTIEMRKKLFPLLFAEYLGLRDYSLQFLQASQLLNRWGNYMDLAIILELIPDNWSVQLISNFLLSALSKLAGAKSEAQIKRSLARATLQRQASKTFVVVD